MTRNRTTIAAGNAAHLLLVLLAPAALLHPARAVAQPTLPDLPDRPESPEFPWTIPGDMDGDGYRSDHLRRGTDCDDTDPTIYPGAAELCDGVDQDCDGEIDEDTGSLWYADEDEDGWGEVGPGVLACQPDTGYVANTGDCDDHDPATHPEALELMDLQDQNCNGYVDETTTLPAIDLGRLPSTAPRILGDINGDGFDDFVVGDSSAYLFLGAPRIDDVDPGDAVARFDTAVCGGQTGTFLPLGDLDADGYDDFGYWCHTGSGYTGTFLNLYAGRSHFSDFDLSQITSSIVSPSPSQTITTVARFTGDLNRDGYADFMLGIADDDSVEDAGGRVVVFYGRPSWWPLDTSATAGDVTITGWAYQHLGVLAETVGDLDHDGWDEIAIADAPESGQQRIYLFRDIALAGPSVSADHASTILYASSHQQGLDVAYAGDLTGDEVDDLVVTDGYTLFVAASESDTWYLDGTMATIESVANASYAFAVEDPEWYQHAQLLPGGDINGDGLDDMVLGSWGGHTTEALASGSVSIVLGVPGVVAASPWPAPSGSAGMCTQEYCLVGSPGSFHGGGDIDGDGHADILVGGQEDSTALVPGL